MRKGWIVGVASVLLTARTATEAEAQATARQACPRGPDGSLPVEPWILGPS